MALLRDTLAADNEIWLARDTSLLAGKYTKMAASEFDFVRGSAALYYRDVANPDPARPATRFLTVPEAGAVLLAGDPHPENFGVTLPGDERTDVTADQLGLEIQDLDGSGFGPWLVDARRGGLGVAVLAATLDGCDDACVDDAVGAFAAAYGDAAVGGATSADDGVTQALRAKAVAEGDSRTLLGKVSVDGAFVLDGDELVALTTDERAQLDRLLSAWAARPDGFRVLDAARRYGAGVASFPAVRYAVLWDTGGDTTADDRLLNAREVVDPPAPPGRASPVPALFDSNAARIEETAWLLWSEHDADIRMAGVADGASTFKVTTWSDWFQGYDKDDLAAAWDAGTLGPADLDAFAGTLGGLLAGAHRRAPTADGTSAADAIAADLGGDVDGLRDELVADAAVDRARADADFALFAVALDTYGPLLGAETPVDDVSP